MHIAKTWTIFEYKNSFFSLSTHWTLWLHWTNCGSYQSIFNDKYFKQLIQILKFLLFHTCCSLSKKKNNIRNHIKSMIQEAEAGFPWVGGRFEQMVQVNLSEKTLSEIYKKWYEASSTSQHSLLAKFIRLWFLVLRTPQVLLQYKHEKGFWCCCCWCCCF